VATGAVGLVAEVVRLGGNSTGEDIVPDKPCDLVCGFFISVATKLVTFVELSGRQ
jgi:hypothetical protein